MQALVRLSFPINTVSEMIIAIIIAENPSTVTAVAGDRINLSGTSFSIKVAEITKALNLKHKSTEMTHEVIAPLFEIHSRVITHVDDTHITIVPATVPEQVRLRADTAMILADICKTTGLKKVDVLHQSIRDFHLRTIKRG